MPAHLASQISGSRVLGVLVFPVEVGFHARPRDQKLADSRRHRDAALRRPDARGPMYVVVHQDILSKRVDEHVLMQRTAPEERTWSTPASSPARR